MDISYRWFVRVIVVLCLGFFTTGIFAEDTLVLSAPPRESLEKGQKTYGPIAEYLSKVLNKKVVYKHPGNWLSYSSNVRKGVYDLVFDGPHFVSWRIKYLHHRPLFKIPGDFYFVFVARKDNDKINKITDLVAKKVCGHAPPNQGTLRLYNQLENPARQPILVQRKGWRNIYKSMIKGDCVAAVVPSKIYKKVDPDQTDAKVLFTTHPTAGQALTASKNFSISDIDKMRRMLQSTEGQAATKNLRDRFASGTLVVPKAEEYDGVYRLLRFAYGFRMD